MKPSHAEHAEHRLDPTCLLVGRRQRGGVLGPFPLDAILFGKGLIMTRAGTWLTLIAALAGTMWATSASAENAASRSRAVHIAGHIDGIRFEGDQFHVWGWACELGHKEPVELRVYADHAANDRPRGAFVGVGTKANLPAEAAVNNVCKDQTDGKHRFAIDLPNEVLAKYKGKRIFIHGLVGGAEDAMLMRSGELQFPDPPVFRVLPKTFPVLSGKYVSSAQHPRVFMTQADLYDMAARINSPGTFSAQRFAALLKRVKGDLSANVDWDAVYSGCDLYIYLHAFSVEERRGYPGQTRSDAQLRAAIKVRPGASFPIGAAAVASRSALYAALVKAGVVLPKDAPNPDAATSLAKKILLAWATRGFRNDKGHLREADTEFCDESGKQIWPAVLQIARGIGHSIHAQDLLQGVRVLSPQEETQLTSFHTAMYEWIRTAHNEEYRRGMKWKYSDETYNNQAESHIGTLLAAARLIDDQKRFDAALYDNSPAIPVSLPWTQLFNYIIYGVSDTPLLRVTPNSSDDPLKSSSAYSTKTVAPGEVNDRYRNATPLQGIGYPVGSVEWLFAEAEVIKVAGLDAYGYRGFRGQSIEMATQYYACYAKYAGFYKTVTAENARSCPNYQQYIGKIVNGVEDLILTGALRFPENKAITELEDAAKAMATQQDALDPLTFGRWRN